MRYLAALIVMALGSAQGGASSSQPRDVFTPHQEAFFIEGHAASYGLQEDFIKKALSKARWRGKLDSGRSWQAYVSPFLEEKRLKTGRNFFEKYQEVFDKAQHLYGVPPAIISGILAIESAFCQNKGKVPILIV